MNKKIYNNLSIENLEKTEWFKQFNPSQQQQIRFGIKSNVDVLIYAKKEFDYQQMEQIRLGLEENVDVSIYAKAYFNRAQMNEIRYYKHI